MQEQDASSFDSYAPLLSPESLRVLTLAHEEALNLQHNFIGTEHLLWGLASEGSLSTFLTPLNITPERVHTGIVFIYSRQAQWTQAQTGVAGITIRICHPIRSRYLPLVPNR